MAALIGPMDSAVKPDNTPIQTINSSLSCIQFGQFETGNPLRRILDGVTARIGLPHTRDNVICLNQQLKDKLNGHKQQIARHDRDMPKIRDRKLKGTDFHDATIDRNDYSGIRG